MKAMKTIMKANERTKMSNNRIKTASLADISQVMKCFSSHQDGLNETEVIASREKYGDNMVTQGKKASLCKRLISAFINPFTIILMILVVVSVFTDIIMAKPGEKEAMTVIVITSMVILSGILRFVQETRSGNAAAKLSKMITTTSCVERVGIKQEIPLEEIVVGDIIHLSAGDIVPADIRIIYAKDLFISQSSLTGESEPTEKFAQTEPELGAILEANNLAFMGTNIISGSAKGVVIVTGNDTILGSTAKLLGKKPPKTSFEKGVNAVSWILIRFMLLMVPLVLMINGLTKGNWLDATLFAISVAVGLTPEMLPMLVTTCLASGAVSMSKHKVIIKNLNAIQNLGSIDILCTDKTGTLTQDKVVLEYHMDIAGKEDIRVLRHAFLNSYYQTGLKNLIDLAIISRLKEETMKSDFSNTGDFIDLDKRYTK